MMVMKHIDKDLIRAFIREYKQEQDWVKRWEANHIEFDNYFKYSGMIEPDKVLISHWKYDHNHNCNDLHEQFIKTKEYEKLWKEKAGKDNPGRFTEEITAHYRDETTDSLWSD